MAQSSLLRLVQHTLVTRQAIDAATDVAHLVMATQTTLPETQVYIGLNDATTKKQEHETDHYVSILKKVCAEHGLPFSFDIINGGYIHDDGAYTEEQTIKLTFIDVSQEAVERIAQDLCRLFHQESVLITTDIVKVNMVRFSGTEDER